LSGSHGSVKRRPTRTRRITRKQSKTAKKLRAGARRERERGRAGHIAQRRKAQRPANKVKRHTAIGRIGVPCHRASMRTDSNLSRPRPEKPKITRMVPGRKQPARESLGRNRAAAGRICLWDIGAISGRRGMRKDGRSGEGSATPFSWAFARSFACGSFSQEGIVMAMRGTKDPIKDVLALKVLAGRDF